MLGIPMLRLLFSFSGFFVVVEVWYVRQRQTEPLIPSCRWRYALTAHLEITFKVKKTGTERLNIDNYSNVKF